MIITICSSIDFTPKIIELKNELEKMGHQVNIPHFTQKIIDGEISYEEFMAAKEINGDITLRLKDSTDAIKRYFEFIRNSDAILVLNIEKKGIQNYSGGNTLMELGFAYGFGKTIYLYNPIPEKSERIHYTDEIIAMKPIVINGNLTEIK